MLLEVGTSGEAGCTVGARDTADAIAIAAEDVFPQVFATSRMIALMELAAARAMRPALERLMMPVQSAKASPGGRS